MKKILALAFVAISFLACSDSDNENGLDPFVGTWYPFSHNGKETDSCERKTTFDALENGTFTVTHYEDFGSGCNIDDTSKGMWINKGNGEYSINHEGGDEYINTISFSSDKNTFVSKFSREEDGEINTYTSTYKRK